MGYGFRPDVDPDASAPAQLAAVGESLGSWRLSWILLLAGAVLAIPGALRVPSLVRKPGDPTAWIGVAAVAIGAVALIAHAAATGLRGAALAEDARDPALAAGAADSYESLTEGVLAVARYGAVALAAGFAVLGLCLYLRGPAPRVAGLVMALGGAILFAGDLNDAPKVAAAGAAVLLIGAISFAFPNRPDAAR